MLASFCRRPLTWLFAVAYVSLIAAAMLRDAEGDWGGIMLVVGVYIVGAAAAVSQRHRLERAAIWLAGVAAVVGWIWFVDGHSGELVAQVIALVTAMALAPLLTAAVTRGVLRLGTTASLPEPRPVWRISIIEILGWMIVVAIASTGLRLANFREPDLSYQYSLAIHGAIAGVIAGLYLTPERRCDRIATALATTIVSAALFLMPRFLDDWYGEPGFVAPIYALFGLWLLVLRLDEAAIASGDRLRVVLPPGAQSEGE
jgi:hypothetical protein